MRTSLSLRLRDVYDPLQSFLQEIGTLVCGLDFSRVELTCYVACILLELPSTAVGLSRKPVPPSPPWFSHDASVLIPRPPPWPDCEFAMWFDLRVLTFYLPLHSSGMNVFKPERMMGNRTVQI